MSQVCPTTTLPQDISLTARAPMKHTFKLFLFHVNTADVHLKLKSPLPPRFSEKVTARFAGTTAIETDALY